MCVLPCAVKTTWHAIASDFKAAAFLHELGISARLCTRMFVRTYGSVPGPPRCPVMELRTCSLADLFTPGRKGGRQTR